MTLLFLLVLALPMVLAVGIVVVTVVVLSRARRAAPVVAQGPDGWVALPSTWNVQVLDSSVLGRMGGTLGSTFGTLALADGRLAYTPDGATVPQWDVACAEVRVRRQGVGPFAVAALRLHGPMGEVACNVSREHINRYTRNSMKDFREAGYATQFVAAAQAHGVRVG